VERAEKFRWKGEDDEIMNAKSISQPPKDKHPIRGVALEPQRIRTFVIEYSPDPEAAAKKAAATDQEHVQSLVE